MRGIYFKQAIITVLRSYQESQFRKTFPTKEYFIRHQLQEKKERKKIKTNLKVRRKNVGSPSQEFVRSFGGTQFRFPESSFACSVKLSRKSWKGSAVLWIVTKVSRGVLRGRADRWIELLSWHTNYEGGTSNCLSVPYIGA